MVKPDLEATVWRSSPRAAIVALRSGQVSLEEVALWFRERSWPRRSRREPSSYAEMAAAAERDPEPDLPGSFDEVYAAYHRRELSREEFHVLKAVALEGMSADDRASGERLPVLGEGAR
jgi:hypothetical protein